MIYDSELLFSTGVPVEAAHLVPEVRRSRRRDDLQGKRDVLPDGLVGWELEVLESR